MSVEPSIVISAVIRGPEGLGVKWLGPNPSMELREWLDAADGEIQLAADGD